MSGTIKLNFFDILMNIKTKIEYLADDYIQSY